MLQESLLENDPIKTLKPLLSGILENPNLLKTKSIEIFLSSTFTGIH